MFSSRFNFLALYYGTVLSFTFLCHNIYCFTTTNKVESLFFVGEEITVGRGVGKSANSPVNSRGLPVNERSRWKADFLEICSYNVLITPWNSPTSFHVPHCWGSGGGELLTESTKNYRKAVDATWLVGEKDIPRDCLKNVKIPNKPDFKLKSEE